MIRYFYIFSLFLFLVIPSCQLLIDKNDSRINPYLEKFEFLCKMYKEDCSGYKKFKYKIEVIPRDLFRIITNDKSVVIGQCNFLSGKITIDENFFKRSSNLDIEMVVLHEIGHCFFNKRHDDSMPSIMNSYKSSVHLYEHFYNYYLNDFFKCKKNCPIIKFDENFYTKRLTGFKK